MSADKAFLRIFRELQPKFSRLYASLLGQAQLSFPQYALLNLLALRGSIPMTEASAGLFITKPAVTNLVDRLEKAGHLRRVQSPHDRRITLLQIQPKGKELVSETQAKVLRLILNAFGSFGSGEQKVIHRFYVLLSKNLDEMMKRNGK